MAIERQATKANSMTKADAFMNIIAIDANGNERKMRKGIPLEMSNLVERSLINKALADPNFTVEVRATIHIVPDVTEETPDIEF